MSSDRCWGCEDCLFGENEVDRAGLQAESFAQAEDEKGDISSCAPVCWRGKWTEGLTELLEDWDEQELEGEESWIPNSKGKDDSSKTTWLPIQTLSEEWRHR